MLYQNREGIFSLKLVCVHSSGSVFRAELKCASGLNLNESRDILIFGKDDTLLLPSIQVREPMTFSTLAA